MESAPDESYQGAYTAQARTSGAARLDHRHIFTGESDMRVFHRNGQHGTIDERDANGFAEFKSDTGARFTVHQTEVVALEATTMQSATAARKLWATWPEGTLRFAIEQGERGASKAFIVARTYPARAADLEDGRIYPGGPSSLLRAAS